MEFLWAFLILIGFFALTPVLSGILGLFIPIAFSLLGFILGVESLIMGIGGLTGSLLNYYNANRYIKTQGAMSNAPRYSKLASIGFIVVFIITLILNHIFNVEVNNFNYWYLLVIAFIAWVLLSITFKNQRTESLSSFKDRVTGFKIVEKYTDDPKWATYLFFKNGQEGWNHTIPGSFRAKDPKNDLTYVFDSKDEAIRYAQEIFKNAQYIED